MTMIAREIQVPGAEVTATPGFACTLPGGWGVQEAPGAVAAFSPADGSAVSVLVSATRVDRDVDLRDVAVRSFARQRRAHPDLTIDSQRVGRFGDRVVYVRGVTVSDVDPVAQVHGLFFGPTDDRRPTADVFSLVGSCPAAEIADYGPMFVDILASIDFDAGAEERG